MKNTNDRANVGSSMRAYPGPKLAINKLADRSSVLRSFCKLATESPQRPRLSSLQSHSSHWGDWKSLGQSGATGSSLPWLGSLGTPGSEQHHLSILYSTHGRAMCLINQSASNDWFSLPQPLSECFCFIRRRESEFWYYSSHGKQSRITTLADKEPFRLETPLAFATLTSQCHLFGTALSAP